MNITSKLLQITLEPKFSCVQTKVVAIIVNVYEPHALNVLHCELEKATFIAVLTAATNHKEIKISSVRFRYFYYKFGMKIRNIRAKIVAW
jgi:hypothetical protein